MRSHAALCAQSLVALAPVAGYWPYDLTREPAAAAAAAAAALLILLPATHAVAFGLPARPGSAGASSLQVFRKCQGMRAVRVAAARRRGAGRRAGNRLPAVLRGGGVARGAALGSRRQRQHSAQTSPAQPRTELGR